MCIVIISYPVNGVLNFEVNLNLHIKPFSYMIKNVRAETGLEPTTT